MEAVVTEAEGHRHAPACLPARMMTAAMIVGTEDTTPVTARAVAAAAAPDRAAAPDLARPDPDLAPAPAAAPAPAQRSRARCRAQDPVHHLKNPKSQTRFIFL